MSGLGAALAQVLSAPEARALRTRQPALLRCSGDRLLSVFEVLTRDLGRPFALAPGPCGGFYGRLTDIYRFNLVSSPPRSKLGISHPPISPHLAPLERSASALPDPSLPLCRVLALFLHMWLSTVSIFSSGMTVLQIPLTPIVLFFSSVLLEHHRRARRWHLTSAPPSSTQSRATSGRSPNCS